MASTKNFGYSTVLTAPSPATSGTSLVVQSGEGAKFPAVPFNATIWPVSTQSLTSNAEIVTVTAIATDTLTIVRAQEGTTARTVIVGDQIVNTVTSETVPMMGILMDKTATSRNYTLLPSTDYMVLDSLEIGSGSSIEIPATSSLEIYSPPALKDQKYISNPYCFRAYDSGGTTLTDGSSVQINLATEVYDYNNNFASSAYTAPFGGVWHFDACVTITGAVVTGVDFIAQIFVDGVAHSNGPRFVPINAAGVQVSADILLSAGQKVTLFCGQDSAGNEATDATSARTWFAGHLVHALP